MEADKKKRKPGRPPGRKPGRPRKTPPVVTSPNDEITESPDLQLALALSASEYQVNIKNCQLGGEKISRKKSVKVVIL